MKPLRGLTCLALLLALPSSPACDTSKPAVRAFDAATPPLSKEDAATSMLPDLAQAKDVVPEVSVVRTLADLDGSYSLVDFSVVFTSGRVVTSKDTQSFSGSMTIDAAAATSTQTITIDSTTVNEVATGMSLLGNQITVTSTSCTYSFTFEFSDEVLTTHVAAYAVCGQNLYSEEDVWRRVSLDVRSGSEFLARRPPAEQARTLSVGAGLLAGAAAPSLGATGRP